MTTPIEMLDRLCPPGNTVDMGLPGGTSCSYRRCFDGTTIYPSHDAREIIKRAHLEDLPLIASRGNGMPCGFGRCPECVASRLATMLLEGREP